MAKRMAKFKRSLEHILPRYQGRMERLACARGALGANNELAENDLY